MSQAIWYFLRQDYPSRELIVVDDGNDPVADLIPSDPRIRYVKTEPAATGSKLNLACDLAGGEYIAHWDDDVWYSPQRLKVQVQHLQDTHAEGTGLAGLLHYQPLTGRLWQRNTTRNSASPHPGTLVYRRETWKAHRFPDKGRDGHAAFLRHFRETSLSVKDGSELAAVILHGSSTGPVNLVDPCWHPLPFAELRRVLGLDLAFYTGVIGAQLRGTPPGPPTRSRETAATRHSAGTVRSDVAPITLAATFMVYDGYGSMAEYVALGMARAGADVHVAPFRIDPAAASPEFRELLERSRPDPEGVVLCHAWWGENLARFGSARDLFIKTVWETSQLPKDWPGRLNRARGVIVPSDFAARVFRDSGVRVPIEVAYEGIDPDVYPYVDRPQRPALTTLVVGVLAPRKNFRQAVAAWELAFAGDPDARLILKARFQVDRFISEDPRIQVIDSNEATRGILHWYRQADVLLALGNEGFGLPVIEGMATGLPVVALDAEAQADVIATRATRRMHRQTHEQSNGAGLDNDEGRLLLPVRVAGWENVTSPAFGAAGVRALPDVEHAARQLRWVAEHQTEAREMGRRASVWAHANRKVRDMGPAILAAIERRARTHRPLRRTYAIWTPGGNGFDGGSPSAYGWRAAQYYARNITRNATQARLYETPPTGAAASGDSAAWRSPILHIHHAPGLIDDEALTRQVQAARHNGMAVVITEHDCSEADRAQAWEQRADVLVALDALSAERLRARWPSKRVEVLPPGCPRWRPSIRTGSERAIAIIAPQLSADLHTEMSEIARNLNARWLMTPLPPTGITDDGEALAAWLNAAADVVLCISDAGATRCLESVALASGLPVVAIDRTASERERGAGSGARPASTSERVGSSGPNSALLTTTIDPIYRPDHLAAGLQEVLDSPARRIELAAAALAYCAEASWQQIGALHLALWRTLVQ